MPVTIRTANPEDAHHLGAICFNAFTRISNDHNFPPDFSEQGIAIGLMKFVTGFPFIKSVVAEQDGKLVGSSFLWLGEVNGVGPVTVAPEAQGSVGKTMMAETVRQSDETDARGVRLVQAAFNLTSMALYTKLGFDVKEPLVCMTGQPSGSPPNGYTAEPLSHQSAGEADELCRSVHGHARTGDVMGAIERGDGVVLRQGGRPVGYSTGLGFFGHMVALDNEALMALIEAHQSVTGSGFLLPSRNSEVFRSLLNKGYRIVQPMTLMARGFYQDPKGSFAPSILY